jgi:hypothetical protein
MLPSTVTNLAFVIVMILHSGNAGTVDGTELEAIVPAAL